MGGREVNAPLPTHLLFCLYSFLFGAVAASAAALLRSVLSALCLLPREAVGYPRLHALFRIRTEKKGKRSFTLGYFLYDLLAGVGFFALYMLFLYAHNSGAFRLYSLLLSFLGLLLFRKPALRILSLPFALLGALLRLLPWGFFMLFKRMFGKGGKKLDERANIV